MPSRGNERAGGLARDKRRHSNLVYYQRLKYLRFDQRPVNFNDRLLGEKDSSLGHRKDVAREAQLAQKSEELWGEELKRIEVVENRLFEAELLERFKQTFKPCGHQKTPVRRQASRTHAETGGFVETNLEVAG